MPCSKSTCYCKTSMARQTCPAWTPGKRHRLQRCGPWLEGQHPCDLPKYTEGVLTCFACPSYRGPKQGTPAGSPLLRIERKPGETSEDYRRRYQREYQRRYRRIRRELRD